MGPATSRNGTKLVLGGLLSVALSSPAYAAPSVPSSPPLPTVTTSGKVAATCHAHVVYSPLPVWARGGFHPSNQPMPHVLGSNGQIVAILWARDRALVSPPSTRFNNKILWAPKTVPTTYSNLTITARRLLGPGRWSRPQVRTVAGGPGPSIINMPSAGCWSFALTWAGHHDSLDLEYFPHR